MIGLLVFIMGDDCTNRGATSGKSDAVLINVDGPFRPSEHTPALALVEDDGPTGYLNVRKHSVTAEVHRVKACPVVDGEVRCGMFGGHFVHTSDSRFPYSSPIPVFDRFETADEQRLYSI